MELGVGAVSLPVAQLCFCRPRPLPRVGMAVIPGLGAEGRPALGHGFPHLEMDPSKPPAAPCQVMASEEWTANPGACYSLSSHAREPGEQASWRSDQSRPPHQHPGPSGEQGAREGGPVQCHARGPRQSPGPVPAGRPAPRRQRPTCGFVSLPEAAPGTEGVPRAGVGSRQR